MLTSVALAFLVVAAPQQEVYQTDTTFVVEAGTRLRVKNIGGDIKVQAWDRNQIRVRASHSSRMRVVVQRNGSVLSLETSANRLGSGVVDYSITAPAWMALELGGMYATVTVEGTQAPIKAETLDGDITVRGGAETVDLSTTQGRIRLEGAQGRIKLHGVTEDIAVADSRGDIVIDNISGSIRLDRMRSTSVDAQTVSGEVRYDGTVAERGRYTLLSHSGNVVMTIPEATSATVSAASAMGSIRASFDLPGDHSGRRRQTFRLGAGGAAIELETFSGQIRLIRPSEAPSRPDR